MVCCRWNKKQFAASDRGERERIAKSVNIFLGCFFLLNYFLAIGFLSYPYSFLYAGYLAAIPTLLLITFTSTITATWELEVMARAQVGQSLVHSAYRAFPNPCNNSHSWLR